MDQMYRDPYYGIPAPMQPDFRTPVVSCENLTKTYGSLCALNGIHLQLPPGRIIGLLGPNGSGKTTLIKILAGLLQGDSGTAKICGVPVCPETKAVVSYLPDRMYYASWMSPLPVWILRPENLSCRPLCPTVIPTAQSSCLPI